MTEISIPAVSLVVLVGVSGSGKSTFAADHFGPFETVSSDYCRALVSNDPTDQGATTAAFELLDTIVRKRLERQLLTVVDATNVQPFARRQLIELAKDCDTLPVAIVLDVPEKLCAERNRSRPERNFGDRVVHRQAAQLKQSIRKLNREGFAAVHVLSGDQIEGVTIRRTPLLNDRRELTGPFDIIGDVHGCLTELTSLLTTLGYTVHTEGGQAIDAVPPAGRTAIFLGDLVDRGPDAAGVLRLVMAMADAGHALVLPGNHEAKLERALAGTKVQLSHGLAGTMAQLDEQPPEFREQVRAFLRSLVAHLVLDGGRLVVAHAGLKEAYHGRASGRVRAFALYGDTTGERDQDGLPVRLDWAREYRGAAMVVYGHTPVAEPQWVNNTICIDTGCAFGGQLTALRYPERELVSVSALATYAEPVRPLAAPPGRDRAEGELTLEDVMGRRIIDTTYLPRITIEAENAAGALEVMSRFALAPRSLPYLPPTMTPSPSANEPGYLEYPTAAFAQYVAAGIDHLICEEKHMGSRAVVLACRSEQVAAERFGLAGRGTCYTRTGRPFFGEELTAELIERVSNAAERAGLWDEAGDWVLLDCELLPWSVKAGQLIRDHYAQVGAAAASALPAAIEALELASARLAALPERGADDGASRGRADLAALTEWAERTRQTAIDAEAFRAAYRHYVWPTSGLSGVSLAPFQLLASQRATYQDRDHGWHLAWADRLVAEDRDLLRSTRRIEVDASDPASQAAATDWWLELTGAGGEGMVVKPFANLTKARGRLAQPGLKVRGREYLRIIYGPTYTREEHLTRLRSRSLGRKASLALREYALGLTALDRLVAGEPLHRVHEAVFAVLALESEPVDPRL